MNDSCPCTGSDSKALAEAHFSWTATSLALNASRLAVPLEGGGAKVKFSISLIDTADILIVNNDTGVFGGFDLGCAIFCCHTTEKDYTTDDKNFSIVLPVVGGGYECWVVPVDRFWVPSGFRWKRLQDGNKYK
jgi:hypothetical protein